MPCPLHFVHKKHILYFTKGQVLVSLPSYSYYLFRYIQDLYNAYILCKGQYGHHFLATCHAAMLHCKLRLFVARITTSVRNKFSCFRKKTTGTGKFVAHGGDKMGNKQSQLTMQVA